MKKTFYSLATFAFAAFINLSAQQTGDFLIGFPSPDTLLTRDSLYLYFHVPASYQPGFPSKMIVGIHGLGNPDTPEKIRNYFAPAADSIEAIVVCPEPYLNDQPRSKLVIDIAIDSVMKWYDVDTNEMYIAGYSAGSDVASKYNLENPKHKMKGLIWYAPGFFYKPNLSDMTVFPPTCLCYGTADVISNILGQVTAIRDSFENSAFEYFYNEIPGVEHTMEFPGFTKEMLECFRFIDDPVNFIPDSTTTGGIDVTNEELFTVYPNPSSGKITIQWTERGEPVTLQLTDLYGRSMMGSVPPSSLDNYSLDLERFNPGIYILKIASSESQQVKRIIISE